MFLPEGPQRVLRFTRQPRDSCLLPTLLRCASPASRTRVGARHARYSTAAQVANCVGRSASHASLRTDSARVPLCESAALYDATTYTQFATWAAHTIRCRWPVHGYSKRVRRSFIALATHANRDVTVRSIRPVGGPQANTRTGGVSRFLLPTFLCGGKEK